MARGDGIGGKEDFGQGSSSPELGRGTGINGVRGAVSGGEKSGIQIGEELVGALGTKDMPAKSPDEMQEQMENHFFELWEAAAQRYFPGQDVEQSIARILYHYAFLGNESSTNEQNLFYALAYKIYRDMDINGHCFPEALICCDTESFFMKYSMTELPELSSSNMDFSKNGPIRGTLLMLINNLDNSDFSFESTILNLPFHMRDAFLETVHLVDDGNFDDDTRKNLKIALKVLLKNLNTDDVNFTKALALLPKELALLPEELNVQQDVLNKYLSWES